MRLGNREYRIALVVFTFLFGMPILMHIVNGMNSRMLADDFCFAANVHGRGFSGAMEYYYYNWQGTFASTAVQSAIALTNSGLTAFLPALLIIWWWIGLIYLMWQLCELLAFQFPRLAGSALATVLLYAIMEGTPTVFQSFYWTSGSVTYVLPMVLFTLWGVIILRLARQKMSIMVAGIVGVIAGLAAALLAGFSPIFAVFAVEVVGFLIVAVWFWRPVQKQQYIILLGIALIGLLVGTVIMIAAPGNSVRQALFEKPSSLLALIGVNLTATASFVGIDLSAFSLVPHLVLLIVGGWLVSSGVRPNSGLYIHVKASPRRWLLLGLGVVLILLFGIFLPTSYNISGFPPGRALVIPHVVMVGLVFMWGAVMALALKKPAVSMNRVSMVMLVAIIGGLVIGPLFSAYKSVSLSPKLSTFSTEWDARDTLIWDAVKNGNDHVTVQPFSVDLADYVNVGSVDDEFVGCLQDYYGIRELSVQKDDAT